jgi:hypothetical protein
MNTPKSRYARFSFLVDDGVTTGEVYWSAVIAGALVTLVGQVLWSLLGAGIGAAALSEGAADAETVAWGGYAYWAVTGIASAAAGGWTAGWVSGSDPSVDRIEGGFQGFLAWTVATLVLTLVILGLAGSPLGFTSVLGGPLVMAAGTATAALWSFFALILGAAAAIGAAYLSVGVMHMPRTAVTARETMATMRPAE